MCGADWSAAQRNGKGNQYQKSEGNPTSMGSKETTYWLTICLGASERPYDWL